MTAFPSDQTIRQQAEANIRSAQRIAEQAAEICRDKTMLEIFISRLASELVISDSISADEAASFRKLAEKVYRRKGREERAARAEQVKARLLAKADAAAIRTRMGGKFWATV